LTNLKETRIKKLGAKDQGEKLVEEFDTQGEKKKFEMQRVYIRSQRKGEKGTF